ncbi:MAG: hypothetical protein RI907_615 [Pseudomonadota bacterium]|jgi:hypothetical protein
MAIMRDKSGSKWLPVALGVLAVAAGAGVWWSNQTPSGEAVDAAQAAASAAQAGSEASAYETLMRQSTPTPPSAPEVPTPPTTEQVAQAHQAMTEQVQAAQQLDKSDIWKPLSVVPKDRPAYVSAMEWQMLKGVAERHADPQAEMLRLTNFLRYTKLLEKWQDLPAGSAPEQRQALAQQLSSELPARVLNAEVDEQEALKQITPMLRDAYPDSKARAKAERDITSRIRQAAEETKASGK